MNFLLQCGITLSGVERISYNDNVEISYQSRFSEGVRTTRKLLLIRQACTLCLAIAIAAPLGGCAKPRVKADTLRVDEGMIYTANLRVSEGTSLTVTRLPKPLREDGRTAATISLETAGSAGLRRVDVDIRKLQGGYGAETPIHETKRARAYFNVSHTKEQDWTIGLRWRLRF